MRIRSYLTLALLVLLLLSLAKPALAEDDPPFRHSVVYRIGGRIAIVREFGHHGSTGAVRTQTFSGYGELTKSENVRIARNIITVDDTVNWITTPGALRNLAMTAIIDLDARPLSAAASAYSNGGYNIAVGDIISPYHPLVIAGEIDLTPLTRQIWAVSIAPNPGQTGRFEADFIAAYGPGPYEAELPADLQETLQVGEDYRWWFDESRADGIDRGDRYVGNYFNIDQFAYTSGGETRRFIDLSSPFSYAYLTEDMLVTGAAEIREALVLENLKHGPRAIRLTWWELF